MRSLFLVFAALLSGCTFAQFVYPKPEYNMPEPGLYEEDPFIIKYRREFFSVFKGDFPRFEKAFAEIQGLVQKNPKDARARVWLGNGLTVKAGLLYGKGEKEASLKMLASSREELDQAVGLSPKDPNIYMMRAATLYIQGQYWPNELLPKSNWEKLRDDCLRFIDEIGPDRIKRTSIHLRGEAYGELGVAYMRLRDYPKAKEAFRTLAQINKGTAYEERALKELGNIKKLEPSASMH